VAVSWEEVNPLRCANLRSQLMSLLPGSLVGVAGFEPTASSSRPLVLAARGVVQYPGCFEAISETSRRGCSPSAPRPGEASLNSLVMRMPTRLSGF